GRPATPARKPDGHAGCATEVRGSHRSHPRWLLLDAWVRGLSKGWRGSGPNALQAGWNGCALSQPRADQAEARLTQATGVDLRTRRQPPAARRSGVVHADGRFEGATDDLRHQAGRPDGGTCAVAARRATSLGPARVAMEA